MWCWRRVGGGLYLCWAGLLFEDGIVTKALALALLAISAHGMRFVALLITRLAHAQQDVRLV